MGAASSNMNGETLNKDLQELVDIISSKYIVTQRFKDMERLADKKYCDNLVILTSKIISNNLNDLEVEYLSDRVVKGIDTHTLQKNRLIYLKKSSLSKLNVKNERKRKALCIGIAKFYVKIAHVFAAIVTTVNPKYYVSDENGNKYNLSKSLEGGGIQDTIRGFINSYREYESDSPSDSDDIDNDSNDSNDEANGTNNSKERNNKKNKNKSNNNDKSDNENKTNNKNKSDNENKTNNENKSGNDTKDKIRNDDIKNSSNKNTIDPTKTSLCARRLNALVNGQDFNVDENSMITVKPNFCSLNYDKKTLKDRPFNREAGISELEKLYYNKYDYKTGKFIGMTKAMRKIYQKDVDTFYKAFTGNDSLPLNTKGKKTITKFSQIPLKDYHKSDGCMIDDYDYSKVGAYRKEYTGSLKEKLFKQYAQHIANMLSNTEKNQNKLISIIDELFSYRINSQTKSKEIIVNPKLTSKSLNVAADKARKLIVELYVSCEKDFVEGVKIFEAIVTKQIMDTAQDRSQSLNDGAENILENTMNIADEEEDSLDNMLDNRLDDSVYDSEDESVSESHGEDESVSESHGEDESVSESHDEDSSEVNSDNEDDDIDSDDSDFNPSEDEDEDEDEDEGGKKDDVEYKDSENLPKVGERDFPQAKIVGGGKMFPCI